MRQTITTLLAALSAGTSTNLEWNVLIMFLRWRRFIVRRLCRNEGSDSLNAMRVSIILKMACFHRESASQSVFKIAPFTAECVKKISNPHTTGNKINMSGKRNLGPYEMSFV